MAKPKKAAKKVTIGDWAKRTFDVERKIDVSGDPCNLLAVISQTASTQRTSVVFKLGDSLLTLDPSELERVKLAAQHHIAEAIDHAVERKMEMLSTGVKGEYDQMQFPFEPDESGMFVNPQ